MMTPSIHSQALLYFFSVEVALVQRELSKVQYNEVINDSKAIFRTTYKTEQDAFK